MFLVEEFCSDELVLGFDPTYLNKSGKHTPDVGCFYNGSTSSYRRGLEIGAIGVVDINQNTAYHLEAIQTPSKGRLVSLTSLATKAQDFIPKKLPPYQFPQNTVGLVNIFDRRYDASGMYRYSTIILCVKNKIARKRFYVAVKDQSDHLLIFIN